MSYPPGPSGPSGPPDPRRYPPPYGPPPTNAKATASLVVGIVALVLSWCCGFGVLGLVAVALGLRAKSEIRRTDGLQPGDGLATAGIALGVLAVLLGLVAVAAFVAVLGPLVVA